jgi:hypothetical protein
VLLQSQTSAREAGVEAEREDTEGVMVMAAEVAREDTREGHARGMEMSPDVTDTGEKTTDAEMRMRNADTITAVASARGRDLESAGDIEVAHQGTEGKGRERDVDVMIERLDDQSFTIEEQGYGQGRGREAGQLRPCRLAIKLHHMQIKSLVWRPSLAGKRIICMVVQGHAMP